MLTIENGALYEYKFDINREEINKFNEELKDKYNKIINIEFCADTYDYKNEALKRSNGDKVIYLGVTEKRSSIPVTITGKIYDHYVKAKVAIYPKLYRILKYNNNDELFESLLNWKNTNKDREYFMSYEKNDLFQEIIKYLKIEKRLLLNADAVKTLIDLDYDEINYKFLKLIPHFEENYKFIKNFIQKEKILIKSNKIDR